MNKGEVWLVEFPSSDGHEQTGTRPVIVLAETDANLVIVVPLTSNVQALRFLHTLEIKSTKKNGLNASSIALVFQVRALDKKRLQRQIGVLEESIQQQIDELLKKVLRL